MKFYFVHNSDKKEVIISARVSAGTLPDQIQEETNIPKDFFITVPVGVLTKPLDNEYNEDLRLRRIKAYDNNLVSLHISKHGNKIPTNPLEFQTHFGMMDNLVRLQKNQTDDFKIDPHLDEYKPAPGEVEPAIPGLDEGWERVTVQRWLPVGVTVETIQEASVEREIKNEVYVAYATSALKPAILYVASDLEHVKEMFAKTQNPNSQLFNYVNWTWYVTDRISDTLQVILDALEIENLSSSIKFYSADEKPLTTITFGQPVVDKILEFFKENAQSNIERKIPELIASYSDDTRAGVCDLITTNKEPTYANLNSYAMNTDTAYIRTGFCGIVWMKESPNQKKLSHKSIEDLVDEALEADPNRGLRRVTQEILQQVIPSVPIDSTINYILSEHEFHFVANRAKPVGVDENILVTNNPLQIEKLWKAFNRSPANIKTSTGMILLSGSNKIVEITRHDSKLIPKLYYINRTQEEIYRLNLSANLHNEFETVIMKEQKFPCSRILFLDELRWLRDRGFHTNSHLLSESEMKAEEEEKKSAEAAAQPRSTQDIQKALDTAIKKLQTNITVNKYERFAELLGQFEEKQRPIILAKVADNLRSNTASTKRLKLFSQQFDRATLTGQTPVNSSGLRKK